MNVVAVPKHDNSKMRVRAYFPVAVISTQEDMKILKKLDTLDIAEEYLADQVKNLNTLIKNNTPKELVQHKWCSDLSEEALKEIAKRATNIKEVLQKRVIQKK